MTKRDYLRDVFRIWLTICQIPFDEVDVYSSGGHWYGQTRDVLANGYDTIITGEYIITFDKNGFYCKKKKTDNFCQYPANEGAIARTGFVDFVTSDNPHCGCCTHVCFDIDLRAYVCRRFGVEVHEQSCCDDWLHERMRT